MKLITNFHPLPRLTLLVAASLLSGCITISDPMMEEPAVIPPSATPNARAAYYPTVTPPPIEEEVRALTADRDEAEAHTPTVTPSPTVTPEPVYYSVEAGDTLSVIARKHGVSQEALMAANGLADADRLSIGQKLLIPTASEIVQAEGAAPALPKTEEGHIVHYVKVGETLSGIAAQYSVARDDILMANGLRPDVQLVAGDTIIIPQGEYTVLPTATAPAATPVPTMVIALAPTLTPVPVAPTAAPPPTPTTHVVQNGDIAGVIARNHGISVDQLAAANPGVNMDSLKIGQTLVIPPPAGAVSATPTAVTLQPTATATSIPPVMATHVVAEGESLTTIAGRYGVPVDALKGHNAGIADLPAPGTVVQVPLGTPTPTASPTTPPTATSTPAPAYVAPVPLFPADGSTWVHWDGKQPLQLVWTASGILKDDEFYVVRLRAIPASGEPLWVESHWTQSPAWRIDEELLKTITGRVTLRWDVMVMRRTSAIGAVPQEGVALSPKSPTFEINFSYSQR